MAKPADMLEGAAAYVERHQIFQLFEGLLQEVIVKRPDEPVKHLVQALKRSPVPRVVACGPPGAQTRSLCEQLAAKQNLVHIIAADVHRDLAKQGSALGKEAKALVDDGKVGALLAANPHPYCARLPRQG